MNLSVFIGRLQLPHNGQICHLHKIKHNGLLLLGSTQEKRTLKNPFSFEERRDMILPLFPNLTIKPIPDTQDLQDWINLVEQEAQQERDRKNLKTITLLGTQKDDSSYYLKLFKNFKSDYFSPIEKINNEILHSTNLRNQYFKNKTTHHLINKTEKSIIDWLEDFKKTDDFQELHELYTKT